MSLDKSAVKQITEQSQRVEVMEALASLAPHYVAVPDGFTLKSLEENQEQRYKFRGHFTTSFIDQFGDYVADFVMDGDTVCFVSNKSLSATAVIDYGTTEKPLHQLHKATVTLEHTPEYSQLLRVNGERLNQRELMNWIEDNTDFVSVDEMTNAQFVELVSKVEVKSESGQTSEQEDFAARQSRYESVAIKAKSDKKLPGRFTYTCCPAEELAERVYEVRLSANTSDSRPYFTLNIISLERHEYNALSEFRDLIDAQFTNCAEGNIPIYIGNVKP